MKYSFFFLPVLATFSAAQYAVLQYGSGELPTCAENCTTLTTAAQGCIPPAAPVTSQAIYDSCFCQSAFLTTNLAVGSSSSVSTICNTACTSSTDQKAIQVWYDSLCKSTSTATTTAAKTTATGTATSSTATSTSTSSTSTTGTSGESSGQIWWHAHARWIAMAIILIVAFIVLGLLGMWLKRRNTRKHRQEAAMAPPVVWGPHQNQHHTGGVTYGASASSEKGKQRASNNAILPTASQGPVDYSEKDGTKKLKKFFKR